MYYCLSSHQNILNKNLLNQLGDFICAVPRLVCAESETEIRTVPVQMKRESGEPSLLGVQNEFEELWTYESGKIAE